jgi:nitrate reductase NapE component
MQHESGEQKQGGWKSWFWMVLCCAPMVAIGVLIALGYWSLR